MSTYARVNSLTKKVDRIIEAESLFFDDRADYDLWIKTSREFPRGWTRVINFSEEKIIII